MVYTCNMKRKAGESTKSGKKVNGVFISDRNNERSGVVLYHFKNFKSLKLIVEYNIENQERIFIQEKGNYCSKLKEGKLGTKKLLKITWYIR